MLRRVLFFGVIAVAFGSLAATPRSEAAPDPAAFVSALGNQGIQTLGAGVPQEERINRFRQIFRADFDVENIGRFALGRYWREMSPEQQQQFLQLFQEATVRAYAAKLEPYGGSQLRVVGTEPFGGEVVVHTEVVRPGGQPVRIDWHVMQENGQYKVTDVFVDRVSMKATQRDEFARVIQNNGGQPSALLAVLRQQIQGNGRTPTAAPPTR